MTQHIDEPVIQALGFDGERFCLKVVFPILRLEEEARIDDEVLVAVKETLGRYGAILKFRAEDLPRYEKGGELIVIDVGQLFQHKIHEA
jgi:hypothetical protein